MKDVNCSTDLAFLSETLTKHSHYVLDYCRNSWDNIQGFKLEKKLSYLPEFIVDAEGLVLQLEHMLEKAKLLQNKGYLNFEQLEAEVYCAKQVIAKARMNLSLISGLDMVLC